MAKKTNPFPYRIEDRTGTIKNAIIAIEDSWHAVRCVYFWPYPYNWEHAQDHTIELEQLGVDREDSVKRNTIYYVAPTSPELLKTLISSLRKQALENGATPEAVRLLGSLEPWTKKEEATLAEKLKSKASRSKPATGELKKAAKSTPVGGAKTPRRGNAEALAKARAARSTGPDTRKIKALVKPKDLTAREGTFRRTMLEDALKSKTVQEFRDKNSKYDAGCLKFAIDSGTISVA